MEQSGSLSREEIQKGQNGQDAAAAEMGALETGVLEMGVEEVAQEAEKEIEKAREVIYWLCQIPFLGPGTMGRMKEKAESVSALFNIEEKNWVEWKILNEGQAESLKNEKRNFGRIAEEYHSLEKRRIKFITILDKEYPNRLRQIKNYPWGMYVRGVLPEDNRPSLAIVGSRLATRYGMELARCFGEELGRAGVQILGGLAAGIDAAGHNGALQGGGKTFGVLGCGVNICYPRENYPLFERLASEGGIISEFPLGSRPLAQHFPVRNRIISGLSDAVLVVEARERSGSLITAGFALDQGKEVFAVPGRVTDPGSAGCNQLIQNGAPLIQNPGDILEFFGICYEKRLKIHEKSEKGLAKKEKMVYSVLDLQPKNIDDVVKEAGLPLSEGMMILLDLELKGFAVHEGGNYYSRKK